MDVIKCVLKVRSGAMQETGGSSAGFLGGVLYIVKHGVIIDSVDEVYSR